MKDAFKTEPAVGTTFDHIFRVEYKLGSGAAGDVYAVTLLSALQGVGPAGSTFALKWYNPRILGRERQETLSGRRIREAAIGRKVIHPSIVRTYDLGDRWHGACPPYLLMELVQGTPLNAVEDTLGERPLSSDTIYALMSQLTSAVVALHEVDIIHRDIKPENVLVTSKRELVLLDLGVARPLSDDTITESRAFLGTLRYAAPEWLRGRECTAMSDAYGVGAVLYRLLAGENIFSRIRPYAELVRAVVDVVPELPEDEENPRLAFAGELAIRLLQKHPANRPKLRAVLEFFERRETSQLWFEYREARIKSMVQDDLLEAALGKRGVDTKEVPASSQEAIRQRLRASREYLARQARSPQTLLPEEKVTTNVTRTICRSAALHYCELLDAYIQGREDEREEFIEVALEVMTPYEAALDLPHHKALVSEIRILKERRASIAAALRTQAGPSIT